MNREQFGEIARLLAVMAMVTGGHMLGQTREYVRMGGRVIAVESYGIQLSPGTVTMQAAGGSGTVAVTATTGQSWTATANVAWISITSGGNGTGNGSVGYSVATYTGASGRTGKITIGASEATIIQNGFVSGPPNTPTVAPASGSGATQTFAYSVSSVNGANNIRTVSLLLNWSLDGTEACWLKYESATDTISLLNDAANLWNDGHPQMVGVLENSQCRVNTATTSVARSANTVTITAPIEFKPAMMGPLTAYMEAYNTQDVYMPWQQVGTWTAYAAAQSAAPATVSVTPSSGTGAMQSFTITSTDLNGAAYIAKQELLVQDAVNGTNACWVLRMRAANIGYLMNDGANAWLGPVTAGNPTFSVENSQCKISGAGLTRSASGDTLTTGVNVVFKSGFAGTKNLYAYSTDRAGANVGWLKYGTWTVDATPPAISGVQAVSVTSSGATIQWTTNEASDSKVFYGTTTAYGSESAFNAAQVTSHSVVLTGLNALQAYHYKVRSVDAYGNIAESGDYTFGTDYPPCSINPAVSSMPNGGATGSIQVTCQAGQPWSASTGGAGWLSFNPTSGTGSLVVYYTATNAGGAARPPANATVAGQPFTVTQRGPSAVTLSPVSTTGIQHDQTFQFHAYIDGIQSDCAVQWTVTAGPGTMSACGLYAAPSLILPGQTSATVRAVDPVGNGGTTGQVGLMEFAPPGGMQVSPASGSALTQNFTFTLTDTHGAAALTQVYVLFNPNASTPQDGCYLFIQPGGTPPMANQVQLGGNQGSGFVNQPTGLGTVGTIENSQCRLNVGASSLMTSGNTMTISLNLTFKPGFIGVKNIYLSAQNSAGAGTTYAQVGTWDLSSNVTALPPKLQLDLPGNLATIAGSYVVSGWALDNDVRVENAINYVVVWIDGVQQAGYASLNQPSIGCNTYPGRAGCPTVGFIWTWQTGLWANGTHTLRVVAVDGDNPQHSAETTRTVTINNVNSQPVVVAPQSPYVRMTYSTAQTLQFSATVGGQASTAVNWSLVSGPAPYTGTSISATGLYTSPSTWYAVPGDQAAVRATRQAYPTDWGQSTVTLMGWLSPTSMGLTGGQMCWFYSSLSNVTFSLSPNLGAINAQGYYTAPASYTAGTVVTITATSVAEPWKRQQALVTLQ